MVGRAVNSERTAPGFLDGEWMEAVERRIRAITGQPFGGTPVGQVLEYALNSGGKRLRPLLLLSCGLPGPRGEEKRETLLTLAAMVELTHLASLIHDDIVDEAAYRRGALSVQKKYGKDAAVYAGDYLIACVNRVQAAEHLDGAGLVLAETVRRMCAGEIGQALCRYRADGTPEQYLENIRGKTAALFQAACGIGAGEGGCPKETVALLEEFGLLYGTLFQIRDDLLDFLSDRREAGKETHKDFRDGIYTLPVLLALSGGAPSSGEEAARAELRSLMEAGAARLLTEGEIARMEALVDRLGGVDATRREMARCQERLAALLDRLEAFPGTGALRDAAALLEV